MSESLSHKAGKGNAARKEIPIKGGRRLDAIRGNYAIEVERSGSKTNLNKALDRLKTQSNKSKILRVPQKDMEKAIELAKKKGINVTITNLSKTKRKRAE